MASSLGGMRIIALPLTSRATSSFRASSALPLTFYQFRTSRKLKQDQGEQNLFKKVTAKAAQTWAGFGKAPEGNWKRRVFVYGEKLIDRIDFEELSLKGVDPSLGPQIGQLWREDAEKDDTLVKIPLIYPPSNELWNGCSPLTHIRSLLSKRTPQHKKGFYIWLGIAPLTAPFALIPIVPNLPFFYAAWRSWSHYRAWKASEYLEGLINSNHVVPEPSPELDELYIAFPPSSQPSASLDNTPGIPTDSERPEPRHTAKPPPHFQSRLLLSREAVPRILDLFSLPESAGADILRAMEQARVRIQKDTSR